jgi:succinate-semialdehyde dehydrogenase/glutarate-semialdehyde dehydrogenase
VSVQTIDPATGQPLAIHEETSLDGLDAILERAHEAAGEWRLMAPAERAQAIRRLAGSLRGRARGAGADGNTGDGKAVGRQSCRG